MAHSDVDVQCCGLGLGGCGGLGLGVGSVVVGGVCVELELEKAFHLQNKLLVIKKAEIASHPNFHH